MPDPQHANQPPKPSDDIRVQPLVEQVRQVAHPLTGDWSDFDSLMKLIDDARYVLIGEASHGTHEFYRMRALITRRLIVEQGFSAICVEADWPDAYRINRYVRGEGGAETSLDALAGFVRFPTWMWRNTVVLDFVGWLRQHNADNNATQRQVGFYGLDLYSLYASIDAVLRYLEQVDPEVAARARERYACFENFGRDAQTYGLLSGYAQRDSCEDAVIQQLTDMRNHALDYAHRDGLLAEDEFFYADQNAQVIKNAEEYYRSMYHGRNNTWNLRDRHMADTLDALVAHLDRTRGEPTKVVVWAHNSHLGDARATEMGHNGEINLGQLMRERHGDQTRLIGQTTYTGTVTAADDWDEPAQRKRVRQGMIGSYEMLFHLVGAPNFLLPLRDEADALAGLYEPRMERAIGVIYKPETERYSHYFYAQLPNQFDAVLHLDETRALEPLERTSHWGGETEHEEAPETYPSAL